MVDSNKNKIYRYSLYVVLFSIITAIVISFLRFMQFDFSMSRVIKISLQKLISNAKTILPCIAAFGVSVITSTKGHLRVVEDLVYLDPRIAALNVNNEEQLEYQKCPEIILFLLNNRRLSNTISYSFLLFAGTYLTSAYVKYFNVTVDNLQMKIKLILFTITFSAILNIFKSILAVIVLPIILVKDYDKIKTRAKNQSEELSDE